MTTPGGWGSRGENGVTTARRHTDAVIDHGERRAQHRAPPRMQMCFGSLVQQSLVGAIPACASTNESPPISPSLFPLLIRLALHKGVAYPIPLELFLLRVCRQWPPGDRSVGACVRAVSCASSDPSSYVRPLTPRLGLAAATQAYIGAT